MQKFLFFIRATLLFIAVGWLNTAAANDSECPINRVILGSQLSILEDPDRSLTIEQVNKPLFASQFRPNVEARTNFGLSRSAFWFRIAPGMENICKHGWLLAIRWSMIDNIEFYWQEQSQWKQITTGAKYPYASRQVNFHTFIFSLPDVSAGHPPYFVRVAGDNPLFMEMRMLQQERFSRNTHRRSILQGVYLGILAGLILYNLFVFLSLRDAAYLYYVIYLVSTILLVAQYSGVATRYLWPDSPEWNIRAFWVFILTGTIAYLAYIRRFLNTRRIAPRFDWLMQGYGIVLLLALTGLYLLFNTTMVAIIPVLGVIGFGLSGIVIIAAIRNGYRPAYFVGAANILLIAGMIWSATLMLGYPAKLFEWNYFVFELGIIIEATLLSLALASRIKLFQRDKLMAQQALLESRHQFSEQLIATQDIERKRVASELHDGIGQNMLVVNNRLNRILKGKLPPYLDKQLRFAQSITQQTIHDLRGLSHLLHPHQLDRLGLAIAIETMAHETLNDAGIALRYQGDAIDHLVDKEHSLHLYRIVQEAVNNIVRHAKAGQVTISLRGEQQAICLKINDNGRGIHAIWFEQKDFSRAFGLSSIQERVHLMAGDFKIFNATPHGITLEIGIPIIHSETD